MLEDSTAPLPAGVQEQLSLALRNGQRLQRLVNDLLDFASIEAGRASPVRVETDVATFTAELAGIFRAATERAGLRLTVDCPPLDRPAFVDPRMWEKVVVNLLANAVKYTFVGGIHVALRPDGDGFALTVSDTGVGIVAEELPQLFHRFHRVAGATARTREGTGIGLALVHELAALHGGDVSVESEPGIGSTFTVALPYGRPDVVEDAARPAVGPSDAARGEAASWEEDTSRPAGPATGPTAGSVLVVDDNADMRAYLTRLLGPHWSVRTTGNGEEALAAVAGQRPRHRADRRDDAAGRRLRAAPRPAVGPGDPGHPGDHADRPRRAGGVGRGPRGRGRRLPGQAVPRRRADRPRPGRPRARRPAPLGGRRRGRRGGRGGRRAPGRVAAPVARADRGAAPRTRTAPRPAGPAPAPREPAVPDRTGQWRLPSERVVDPRAAPRACAPGWRPPASTTTRPTTCCWPPARRRPTPIEHAQDPTEPFFDVTAWVGDGHVRIAVRDYGQWRERVPSMDRGRGSTLMSAVGEITATPSPEGTTVLISSRAGRRLTDRRPGQPRSQVSLLPPPRAAPVELGPAPSATRVSGAGSADTVPPPRATENTRRSTCRGCSVPSTRVGAVEVATGSWATKR